MLKKSNKYYYIIGVGRSGYHCAQWLQHKGHRVQVWDDNTAHHTRQEFTHLTFVAPDKVEWNLKPTVIMSPGIAWFYPTKHAVTLLAEEHGCEILCDMELWWRLYPKQRYIGVTGSNGKSTTSALIAHMLSYSHCENALVGNIGNAIFSQAPLSPKGTYVCELSSFQLELMHQFHPKIGILLNITPNHLDRHATMEAYCAAKLRLFQTMGPKDTAIIGADSALSPLLIDAARDKGCRIIPISTSLHPLTEGLRIYDNVVYVDYKKKHYSLPLPPHYLPGEHNAQNIAAALATMLAMGRDIKDSSAALPSFKSLPHRSEYLGTWGNITVYNDSKATTGIAAAQAIKALPNSYWIAGGIPKADSIMPILPHKAHIRHAFLYGQCAAEFASILAKEGVATTIVETLKDASQAAVTMASESSIPCTIVLSPAAASFDQFKDYEARGDMFKRIIHKLMDTTQRSS